MKSNFDILRATRKIMLSTIDSLSLKQLNHIPSNFNNNIAWNFCHVYVVQHLLTYGLSGMKHDIPDNLIHQFKKGSKPEKHIDQQTIDYFKARFMNSVDLLANRYNNKEFIDFSVYPTSYGYELNCIEDAIKFNNVHEALHFGYILAMKKFV